MGAAINVPTAHSCTQAAFSTLPHGIHKKESGPYGTALHVLCVIECCYDATDYYFLVRTILVAENQV